jgi:hypothetical protein
MHTVFEKCVKSSTCSSSSRKVCIDWGLGPSTVMKFHISFVLVYDFK